MTDQAYTILVIDDERNPIPASDGIAVLLYRNSKDGLEMLKIIHTSMGRINELWLDHDLGLKPGASPVGDAWPWDDIMPVVNWLEEQGRNGTPLDVDYVFVHTANPAAAPVMMAALRPYYNVIRAELPVADESE